MKKIEIELKSMNLEQLSSAEEKYINGGGADPYNIIHRNYPWLAAIGDFVDGIAEGFKKGADAGSEVK